MAESVVLVAQKRDGRGSRKAHRLRASGQVPGVVYGHKQATVSVALPGAELAHAIRHGTRVLDLKMDAGTEKVLISEVQWDHLGKDVLHVDLTRVSADERIKVSVPLEVRGTAPGVTAGGILDQLRIKLFSREHSLDSFGTVGFIRYPSDSQGDSVAHACCV